MGEYAVGVATRTRIYQVCKGLFYEKGIKATSYNDICEAADINRGLIPYYFKSKNNIAIEVLRDFVDSMEGAVSEWWGPDAMVQPERNIMIELLMFRLLAEDERACRFYSEIRADGAFHESTLKIQEGVMRTLAQGSGVQVSNAALRTVTSMVEGTETELVQAVYHGYLEESIEDMVRRDISCCFFLLGVDSKTVEAWCDHVFALAEGFTMKCDERFECRVIKREQ